MRAIDADALMTELYKEVELADNWKTAHEIANIVKYFPTIEVPQWIPCTERLPDKSGKYLVSVRNGNVYAGTFDAFSGKFQCAAVAWMPLPEPYRQE